MQTNLKTKCFLQILISLVLFICFKSQFQIGLDLDRTFTQFKSCLANSAYQKAQNILECYSVIHKFVSL
jgi:hypothetical protein